MFVIINLENVRTVSSALFYITRLLAFLYLLTTLYSFVTLLTECSFTTRDSGNYFSIFYPFTETPFLNGENNWAYKALNFLMPIGFYGVFFLLLSNIFNVFKQPKLFTQYGVNQLRWFYLANIFLPSTTIFLATVFAGGIEEGLG